VRAAAAIEGVPRGVGCKPFSVCTRRCLGCSAAIEAERSELGARLRTCRKGNKHQGGKAGCCGAAVKREKHGHIPLERRAQVYSSLQAATGNATIGDCWV